MLLQSAVRPFQNKNRREVVHVRDYNFVLLDFTCAKLGYNFLVMNLTLIIHRVSSQLYFVSIVMKRQIIYLFYDLYEKYFSLSLTIERKSKKCFTLCLILRLICWLVQILKLTIYCTDLVQYINSFQLFMGLLLPHGLFVGLGPMKKYNFC